MGWWNERILIAKSTEEKRHLFYHSRLKELMCFFVKQLVYRVLTSSSLVNRIILSCFIYLLGVTINLNLKICLLRREASLPRSNKIKSAARSFTQNLMRSPAHSFSCATLILTANAQRVLKCHWAQVKLLLRLGKAGENYRLSRISWVKCYLQPRRGEAA